jgi:hypothetical protein
VSKEYRGHPPAGIFQPEPWGPPANRRPARVFQPEPNRPRLLYKSSEAKRALDVGETKFWELVNAGTLDARRIGRRVYITAESLEGYVVGLPRAITPTMEKADRADRAEPRPPAE